MDQLLQQGTSLLDDDGAAGRHTDHVVRQVLHPERVAALPQHKQKFIPQEL